MLNISGPGGTQKIPTGISKGLSRASGLVPRLADKKQTFTKIFRWHPPVGQKPEPAMVEIVGTFTHWQKMPLIDDRARGGWQVTLDHIAGHRTHHYMLLADGKPVQDPNCDGLAIPRGPVEEQFAIATARGPRVFMLFAQTK